MPDIDLALIAAQFTSIGGPVMAILVILSIVATATTISKIVQFAKLGIGAHQTAERSLALWADGERKSAFELVDRHFASLSQVSAETMRSIGWVPGDVEQARESGLAAAAATLAVAGRRLRLIETIVQAAPMLGLLGTVLGMIEAFGELAATGGVGDPGQLAGGIWVALSTTALGLAIAIPFYFASNWLEERLERERIAMEAAVTRVLARSPKRAYATCTGVGPVPRADRPGTMVMGSEGQSEELRLG